MILTVTKRITTETGHRLINYNGKCAHLHGHRYEWEVTVSSLSPTNYTNDQTGMVVDFKDLKAIMKEVIEPLDHAFVLCEKDPLLQADYATIDEVFMASNGDRGRLIVLPVNPTAENLVLFVAESLKEELDKKGLRLDKVKLWETEDSYAELLLPPF